MKKKLNILLFGMIPLLVTSCSSVDVIHKDNLNIVSISVLTDAENNVFEIGKFDEYETKIKVEYSDQSINYFPLTKNYIPSEYSYALTTPGKYNLDLLFRGEVFTFSFESAYFYDVNFYNGNNLIYTDHVKEGDEAEYLGEEPTKASDKTYSYLFRGWDKDLTNVTESYSTYALFDSTDRLYEITWLDYDETILLKENYKYGEIPSYKNEEPSHDEMIFDKWVPEIKSVTESTTYTAKFNFVTPPSYYEVYVFANNPELGKASGSGSYCFNEQVTVTAEALGEEGDVIFKGWYDDDSYDNCLSTDLVYSFEMPEGDVTLYAKFLTKFAAEEEARKYGTRPMLSSDGKTITYGLYPQTNVNDSSLISSLNALTSPESNGWYLYNNEYYAKVSANPCDTNFFDNGNVIKNGTIYWFKCEPITWNVLSNNNGEYYILSSVLLDAHCYYNSISNRNIDGKTVYPNNYEYSDIRTWLNTDFYNTAFALGNSNIQTTMVDNSPETTGSSSNPYACDNTQDKVFLPSYQDYINSNYGFSTSIDSTTNTRACGTTDWARARGGYCNTILSDLYKGNYWTRSPFNDYSSDYAWCVGYSGFLGCIPVDIGNFGVRPALVVKNVSTAPTQDEEWSKNHGVIPVIDEINKTITYGLYPQTNVNDSSLISSLNTLTSPESNGWYLYNNEYYAKVSANPYGTNYEFDNGTFIENGTIYWFKCEPITWNILSNNNGEYYILSSVLLDTQTFGEGYYSGTKTKTDYKGESGTVYANNYKFSDIRTWLNTDFYNTAFALGNSNIQTTIIDNSPETTGSSSNRYACDNTQDKVFLLSYQDYINSNYGFSTSSDQTDTRYCRTTDWARARGAYYYTSSGSYQYNGYYWTRSPYSDYSDHAWCVGTGGYFGFGNVNNDDCAVRPALNINL